LTLVECKLWKNPEARRQVVAQTLDCVSALSRWSYADLQAKVAAALRKQGNNPFELVQKKSVRSLGNRSSLTQPADHCVKADFSFYWLEMASEKVFNLSPS
jgi:hypothetical protein